MKKKKYSLISVTTPRSISPYSRRKVQTHNPQISQSDSDLSGFPSSNGTWVGSTRLCRRRRGNHGPSLDHPRPWRTAQGTASGDAQSAEAVYVGGSVLPVSADGYILEVWDEAELRGRVLLSNRAPPSPEIYYEKPEECVVDRCCSNFLLASLLGHSSCCEDRAVESARREAQEQGVSDDDDDGDGYKWILFSIFMDYYC